MTRLISLLVPFMMVALSSGKQRKRCGPAVNVPTKLSEVCEVLPRLPSESELIPLKFKCEMVYKGHYMYGNANPDKLINAFRWLKTHNPKVTINDDWIAEALHDNFDLVSRLIEHCDVSDKQGDSMEHEPSSSKISEESECICYHPGV